MEWIKEFDELCNSLCEGGTDNIRYYGRVFITAQITKAREEEWKRCVDLLDQDHKGHILPQTCIGYGNAQSDLMNNPPNPHK